MNVNSHLGLLANQISAAFSDYERGLVDGRPEKRAASIDRFADMLQEFTCKYIEGQRAGMEQFTREAVASRYPQPPNS